jgi:hypothetical protein
VRLLALSLVMAGCSDDLDPPWQLDHDRIIAVRATPPRIAPGARSELDTLFGHVGAAPTVELPSHATVLSPTILDGVLALEAGRWVVTAPDDARLAAARTELALALDAPVPLVVRVSVASFDATKTVWLGDTAANPTIEATIDNALPPASLVVPRGVDVPLSVSVPDSADVNWLTSCGTLHDYDLAEAYLHVEDDDPDLGELGVVIRTPDGGTAWQLWPIRAE